MTQSMVYASSLQREESPSRKDRCIWARVAIVESPYPVIAADDVVLCLFGNRLVMRVSSTCFTVTIYFYDVKQAVLYDEHNTVEMQVILDDGAVRAYVIMCTDAGVALMLYDVLLPMLPADVENNSSGHSNTPSFHTTDYPFSLLSPHMMQETGFYEVHSRCSPAPLTNEEAHERECSATSRHCFSSQQEQQLLQTDKKCLSSLPRAPSTSPTKLQPAAKREQSVHTPAPTNLENSFKAPELHNGESPIEELPNSPRVAWSPDAFTKVLTAKNSKSPSRMQVDKRSNDSNNDEPRLLTYAIVSNEHILTCTPDTRHRSLSFCPITPVPHHPSHSLTPPSALRASMRDSYSHTQSADRPAGPLHRGRGIAPEGSSSPSVISNSSPKGVKRLLRRSSSVGSNNNHIDKLHIKYGLTEEY